MHERDWPVAAIEHSLGAAPKDELASASFYAMAPSLAPLMDDRRYVESAIAGIKVKSHRDFRLCVTMNDDASVYELPGYIQSRLKPKIEIVKPPWVLQEEIVRTKCPGVDDDLLRAVFTELQRRTATDARDSIRNMLTLTQYAQKLRNAGVGEPMQRAMQQVLLKPDVK